MRSRPAPSLALLAAVTALGFCALHMVVPALPLLATAFDDMLVRLEDSFTRLSQFSADLAHELRTPIANILGEGQVALTGTAARRNIAK